MNLQNVLMNILVAYIVDFCETDFGTKSQWLTRDKLKADPKNSQVASPFIDQQDPKPSETSDITDTVSSESEDEMILEGDTLLINFLDITDVMI